MLFAPWLMVLAFLLVTVIVFFVAFVIWLAHTLEGYPMLLIQNGNRNNDAAAHSLRSRPILEYSQGLDAFADNSGVRARTMHDEMTSHRVRRF